MKTLITYAYYETDTAKYNFEFFVQKEIQLRSNIDYNIVINGHVCSVSIPSLPNVTVLKRDNVGFDLGAYNASLQHIDCLGKKYDYYFFINSGAFGPVLPYYSNLFLMNFHWSSVFINKITDTVKLVGTTIVCLPETDLGGFGPKVEGFCFLTDQLGLDILKREGSIFRDHPNKTSAIVEGEYGISRTILKEGYSIDCMLKAYHGIDWRNKKNWRMNKNKHPSRKGTYFGFSIDPYEVIFHKWKWIDSENVNFDIIDQYKHFSNM